MRDLDRNEGRASLDQAAPAIPAAGIPFLPVGGPEPPLVFLHANGFPPGCYEPLLKEMAGRHRTLAMLQRPLWPESQPTDLSDWHVLSRDLLKFLDERALRSVIVVGHSMGAIAALRAALWEPERFAGLVLLEPVLLPHLVLWEWWMIRSLGLGRRLHPLIAGAMRRQRTFNSLEAAFQRYRARPLFRYFSDESLQAYIVGMTRQLPDGGFGLTYSPEWEARIYATNLWKDWDLWRGIPKLRPPTLIVRGAESDTLRESTIRQVGGMNRRIRIEVVNRATHLLPLEQPERTSDLIESLVAAAREAATLETT